jgi:hypothetical protein
MYINLAYLKRGQIIARKYIGWGDRLPLRLAIPRTDFAHYAIMADPIAGRDDWFTFNANVGNTIELIPLSCYKGQMVRIYSVKDGDAESAYLEAKRLLGNRVRYEGLRGWNYFFRLLPSLLVYWLFHGPRLFPWDKLPNVDSPDRINCIVLVRRCYPNLIPANRCALAAAFEQAYHDGKLILEQEGTIA